MKTFVVLLALCLSVSFLPWLPASNASLPAPQSLPLRSVEHLKTGTFLYREREGDADPGKTSVSIERLPNSRNFRFAADISGKFAQQWESIASPSFDPISAKLTFGDSNPSMASSPALLLTAKVQPGGHTGL